MSPTPAPSATSPALSPAITIVVPSAGAPTARTISTVQATPAASQPSVASPATATVLSGAVIAALLTAAITACIAVWAARRKSREEERARQRDLFANAYQAYAAYKELPYAIRRRRHDDLAAERVRLSESVREIQGRLTYYEAWIAAESETVSTAYTALVRELRKIAGGAMHDAWLAVPITDDAAMNISPKIVDLSALGPMEKDFTAAVRAHLAAIAPVVGGMNEAKLNKRTIRSASVCRRLVQGDDGLADVDDHGIDFVDVSVQRLLGGWVRHPRQDRLYR